MRRGRSCAWPDVAARLPDVARTSSHRGSGEPGEAHATMQGAAESTPMARITGRQPLWTSPLASLFTRTGEMGSEFPRATIIRDMRLWLSAGHGTAVLQTIFETNTVDQGQHRAAAGVKDGPDNVRMARVTPDRGYPFSLASRVRSTRLEAAGRDAASRRCATTSGHWREGPVATPRARSPASDPWSGIRAPMPRLNPSGVAGDLRVERPAWARAACWQQSTSTWRYPNPRTAAVVQPHTRRDGASQVVTRGPVGLGSSWVVVGGPRLGRAARTRSRAGSHPRRDRPRNPRPPGLCRQTCTRGRERR